MAASPFFCLEGRWYVQPFEETPSQEQLVRTMDAFLLRRSPHEILLLRQMSPAEVRFLMEHREDCLAEILSMILAPDEVR